MPRSPRFPLWHWIVFGGTFTAALISMGAVVASLLFYRSRTSQSQRPGGSGSVQPLSRPVATSHWCRKRSE
jgi:hypothetical protein